jgi:kynurenine formamidase
MKKLHDLSHLFDENTYHPFGFAHFRNIQMFPSHGCRHAIVTMSLHFATHIDAPWHMVEKGKRLDTVDIGELAGDALAVNVSEEYGPDRKELAEISLHDLKKALSDAGQELRPRDSLIVYTGWARLFYTDPTRYYTKYSTLSNDACAWLIEQGVRLVGLDVPDIDLPDNYTRMPFRPRNHRTILGNGVFIIENVGGEIEAVLGRRFMLLPAPMKLGGEYASGAPTRLLAMEL